MIMNMGPSALCMVFCSGFLFVVLSYVPISSDTTKSFHAIVVEFSFSSLDGVVLMSSFGLFFSMDVYKLKFIIP